MEKEINVAIHNRFDFVRRDAKTGEVLGKYKAENIILNNFWTKYLSTGSMDCLKYIHFGTGTTTPVATDVKLTTWLGYKTAPVYDAAGTVYDYSNYHSNGIIAVKKSVRLEDTEYNGSFISEVGYSSTSSSTTGLLTKALVKDMNGNVVSIEKKAGEVLDIYATFYLDFGPNFDSGNILFGQADPFGTITLFKQMLCAGSSFGTSPATYYLQGRPQPQDAYRNLSAPNAYANGNATVTFDTTNKKLMLAVPNLVATNGNLAGGIRGLMAGSLMINLPCTGYAQPILTKEVVGAGDGSTVDFQTAFGYIKNNGTAKVFVNDVEVAATIDYDKLYPKTNIINDMKIIDYKKLNADGTLCIGNVLGATTAASSWWVIAENPFFSAIPVESIRGSYFTAYASNDLTNWVQVAQNTGGVNTRTIAAEYQNYRYWKIESYSTSASYISEINSSAAGSAKNIHTAVAPASGATVAVTYQPDCIAKDAQHVLNNVKVTLTFNEYTPT